MPRILPIHKSSIREPAWIRYNDQELLDMRFCDLKLTLNGASIARHLQKLYRELEQRQLKFRPHVWLADEWFSPDGIPGFTIPFYLAHPRLMRLERKMMQEVEGGNRNWLMRILRHETGHAFDTAYRLRRRKDWRETFGYASRPYPKIYRPILTSKKFVLHLGHWYAQAHPTEDFAETFAVWLQPRSKWRREYTDWPALTKLQYVDQVMHELQGRRPVINVRDVIEPLSENTRTLREHYRREAARYAIETTTVYDSMLLRVFARNVGASNTALAPRVLNEWSAQFTRWFARNSDFHPYLVKNVMRSLIERCRELDLVVSGSRREAKRRALKLTERVMFDMMHKRKQKYAL